MRVLVVKRRKKGKGMLINFIFPKTGELSKLPCPFVAATHLLPSGLIFAGRAVGTSNSAPPWVPFGHKFGISLK